MEHLLQFVWKHKLFPLTPLHTTQGQTVEVIDPGLPNPDAGPDFFNAKIKIDGILWVGNVEIHVHASDWKRHHHHQDRAYDSVILHVASDIDAETFRTDGTPIPQMELHYPPYLLDNYRELIETSHYPACYRLIPRLPKLLLHSWLSSLQTERFEQKTQRIQAQLTQSKGDWEQAFFLTLARNFGFGTNSDAFEQWALGIPLHSVDHHRDNLFQIEAIFLGQAGLLELNTIPEKYQKDALNDGNFSKLRNEYLYLAHKFSLTPMDSKLWRFLRLRPQNFPHIRLSQLANLYFQRKASLSQLLDATSVKEAKQVLSTSVTPYWETHYTFGSESIRNEKHISPFSLNLLVINTVIPILFAYGRHRGEEKYCDRAFDFLESLHAENNHIVRMWQQCGLPVENAGDSQALIQLKKEYCDKKECLRCRIGYEYLKRK